LKKIYKIIADLREDFEKMTYGLTTDKNEVDEVVQELFLYFLQMNPKTLKGIYDKDGEKGIIKYGAVVIRRSLQSKNSPYYYKYKKYYTNIDLSSVISTYDITNSGELSNPKNLYNIPETVNTYQYKKLEEIDKLLDNIYWYDRELFKLYYYEQNTLDSLAKKTGISRNSLFTTIDNVRNLLKEKLNE
tara:strand:+ start:7079 stop:7642 length:564 start_codon:yes stop_codon:yes gene_type:complete